MDAERARFVRRPVTEILNSAGEWEPKTGVQTVSLGELLVRENDRWVLALSLPRMLDGRGFGNLCKLREKGIYGREIPLATLGGGRRDPAGEMAAQTSRPGGGEGRS